MVARSFHNYLLVAFKLQDPFARLLSASFRVLESEVLQNLLAELGRPALQDIA